jgi:hypothetical protein
MEGINLLFQPFQPLSMTPRPPIVTILNGHMYTECQPSTVDDFMRGLHDEPRDTQRFYARAMFDYIGRTDLSRWVLETWTHDEPHIEDAIAVLEETSVYFRGHLFDSMHDALMWTYMRSGMVVTVENLLGDVRTMGILKRDGPHGPTSIHVGDRLCPWKENDYYDTRRPYWNLRPVFDRGEDGQPENDEFFLDFDTDDFRIIDIIAIRVAAKKIIAAMRTFVKRVKACRVIQFHMRPWLDKPKCADGTIGIRPRIALRDACADGVVTSSFIKVF